jgi:AcrR family transcriptional regulator
MLRLRAKQEKRERIKRAAMHLFRSRGFEATTTRAIATRAGVATGTLFLYARTKEQVLALAFADEVERVWAERVASAPARSILDQLVHITDGLFDYYARDPALARWLIKELTFLDPDAGGDRPLATLAGPLGRLTRLVGEAQQRGELDRRTPAQLLASNLFAVYQLGLIAWLQRRFPDDAAFRAFFRASVELCLTSGGGGGG